ncbi:glycerophosphodiester phosphodiesterase [Proteiniphilum sp. UBA5384]|uniref:glycerophosphodiester phosphodiesterase n=1 Tax=Proteiniphilum sp. UBA5384 TaxID=1947279 RepID=UPI0025D8C88D|nr:glycerophosphodiester phosphodiesterase family protein [Proteiniphilum sp. UBA5384]
MDKKIYLSFLFLLFVTAYGWSQTQVIAHRGFWKTEGSAQNSIASLMKADSIGVYGSEMDMWITPDGIPVVHHDADATLNGEKLIIQDTPFATLRKVKLANGEPIPTVEEYLDAFSNCKHVKLIMEFKTHRSKEREDVLVEKVINMVRERGLGDRVEYIAFGLNFVQQARKLAPDAPVYYLNGDLSPKVLDTMNLSGFDYNLKVVYNKPEWVKEAHALGQKVNVWTVNKPEDIQKIIDLGVDFITTDEPVRVKEMLQAQ